jgi:DNA-directed RNA polymerase subunit alpha
LVDKVFPRIEASAVSKKYGCFIVSPLEPGYGVTLGNALRRVLLSSLPGAAAVSMRVTGVQHEFGPIPGAVEDMVELMLNIKQVRFRLEGVDSARLRCHVRGPAEVTAADLEAPAGVEVVNPEQHLVSLDSAEADFELELTVATGKGYSPAEERGSLPIGEIPLDAIFTPVRRAAYRVERERVGPTTDFDRLVLEVWTDGTIGPEKALSEAARILVAHFQLVATAETVEVKREEEVEAEERTRREVEAALEAPIETLGLNMRSYNCLKRAGFSTVGQVLAKIVTNENELLNIRNFGAKSLEELKQKLRNKGVYPPPEGFRAEEILAQMQKNPDVVADEVAAETE